MAFSSMQIGFVYVLTNVSFPGLVKVGLTFNLPEDRSSELNTTGIPTPFDVAFRATTSWPRAVEARAHELLAAYRVSPKREFFRVDTDDAINAVRLALIEAAGIDSWRQSESHMLLNGSRLALTLEAGQLFALISYNSLADIITKKPQPLDFWQAHSDGDLLEIYVTDSPGHVAGLSDNDPGGTDEPVPYLNRDGDAYNGLLIGRERLMPGERLVWVPAPASADTQERVIFEACDHCQLTCRTWSPVIGLHGLPLLLNDLQHDTLWPAAERAVRAALALPVPRTWAPRGDRDSSWATIGTEPPNPEHWLPQLKRKRRKR